MWWEKSCQATPNPLGTFGINLTKGSASRSPSRYSGPLEAAVKVLTEKRARLFAKTREASRTFFYIP